LHKGLGGTALAGILHREVLNKLPHLHADEPADIVLHRLGQSNLGVLPVVDRRDVTQILGQVTLEDLLEAYRNASA
jgi:CBS domain-containing protein